MTAAVNLRRHLLLSVAEMTAADEASVAAGVNGKTLMEAAGAAVAVHIVRRYARCPVAVLCGPGNNGGDGFVAARHLAEAGWEVRLALLGKKNALKNEARAMAKRWTGPVEAMGPAVLDGAGLVIDALFGAGLTREVGGAAREALEAVVERGLPVAAVDMPSGVHGDTGEVLGIAPVADVTVTFVTRKTGHVLMPGRHYCGETVAADIGTPDSVLAALPAATLANDPELWLDRYPWPRPDGQKYDRGYAVVVASNPEMTGAARLAARAALRTGAGLVGVLGPREATAINAPTLAAVMTASYETNQGFIDFLSDKRRNAVLLGPGNGVTPETRQNVLSALALGKACVLDADALTVFQDDAGALFAALRENCLLTPHTGEFSRLFGVGAGNRTGKLTQTRAAAALSGAAVLYKGADTVIAAPDGRAVINANAPPDLATAGAGDVLAGMAVALLAQGLDAFTAACAAAWLHGEAARAFGPGLISEDLNEMLPQVLRQLKERAE